jgi:predicted component of type VI protein secretion system
VTNDEIRAETPDGDSYVAIEQTRYRARLAELDAEISNQVTKREFHNAEVKRLRGERRGVERLLRATLPRGSKL